MRAPGKKSGPIADINITPLLDLAWVLLVIFILTTTALVQGIEVKLPETADHKEEVPTEVATVAIDRAGLIYLNDERIELGALEEKLRIFKLANPALPVILRADRTLAYEQVVKVLDSIKRVPVENLALATEVQ
ncbi:MAG TPA: biopolymer transporter ExbD [Myxococcota bacterium]|nr:biopolymer transporter ExbD [Myxococcota bacterium]